MINVSELNYDKKCVGAANGIFSMEQASCDALLVHHSSGCLFDANLCQATIIPTQASAS
jgi:hypothetical protein